MKKLLTLLSLLVVAVSMFAQEFTIGDLTYSVLSEEEKTAQVVNGKNATGDVVVHQNVTYGEAEYHVTSIGDNAFYGNASITSISMPYVTTVQSYAFYDCYALTSINVPEVIAIGSYAFSGCESLTEAAMPKVENLGMYAFGGAWSNEDSRWHDCTSLKYVDLSSVKSIGNSAFQNCSNISSLRIGNVDQWCLVRFDYYGNPLQNTSQTVELYVGDSETPAKNLVVSSTLTEIPAYSFNRVSSIESFSAPAVTTVGEYAFSNCSSLTSVNLPLASSIEHSAFTECTSLLSMDLPKARFIGGGAFMNCTSLVSIELPEATSISGNAFSHCTSLVSVDFPVATSIGVYTFLGCLSLKSAKLPVASSIDQYAFSGCESLEEAIMPKVETIGARAFGENYEYYGGEHHFYKCGSLKYVDLSSVRSIGSYAFQECYNISSLRIGSIEQWCKVNFGDDYANPLERTTQPVKLYVGDSDAPIDEVSISDVVTEVPSYAFKNTTITSVSAPSVNMVKNSAFNGCASLISVNLPATETIGWNAFEFCTSLVSVNLPSVVTVQGHAFADCASLVSINLPSATVVGDYAFQHCKSLEYALMPKVETLGEYAFRAEYNSKENRWDTSLKRIDLSSVISIGDYSFYSCSQISHLELPEVKDVGRNALGNMTSLKYLSIPEVENIGQAAFSDTSIDSLHVGSIEQYCNIKYETGIEGWSDRGTFPFEDGTNNLIFIGESMTPATEITIFENVEQVPDYAFYGTDIHTIHFEGTIPPTLATTNSFSGWTMLAVPEDAYETYLAADVYNTIPLQIIKDGHITQELEVEAKSTNSALLAKIGDKEIRNVVNLKLKGTINSYDMLIIRNRMTSLRNLDLSEVSIVDCDYVYSTANGNSYHSIKDEITADWMSGLMNVKLPANTKTIGDRAFYYCYKLVSVDIPNGVTSIGEYAFNSCSRIKSLTLPQSVVSFGSFAFEGCRGLREVIIPNGVTRISNHAFSGCIDLENVTIPASVTNIGYNAFSGNISLRISDLNTWKDVTIGEYGYNSGAFGTVERLYIGDSDIPVENIVIPAGTTVLKDNTFRGFKCMKSVTLPDGLTVIGDGTFRGTGLSEIKLPKELHSIGNYAFDCCYNMEKIVFNDNLKNIGANAFSNCSKLKEVELPSYLENIGKYAFAYCYDLTQILIPASIEEIGDYAFQGCNNLNTVIATTVEPITINQNTFSTYRTANVYSPKTSYWKYYWNTQWNQFLSVNEYGKKFGKRYGYKYFYLRGHHGGKKEDFEIDDDTETIAGTKDEVTGLEKAPDADFGEESGMIVGGEQIQKLGDIHIHHNGNNGASVIAKNSGKVHIDNLYVDIKTQPNRWYFFSFPFDINPGEAAFGGSHVWYLYDGEARAKNGNGGWKKVASDGVMKSGNGYIFQGAVNGTLTIHVKDITIDTSDSKTNLITYQSENKNDASWNLIGNANYAYYGISDLMLENPVTVYNNETGNYEAVRAGDDDYEFYPFQAFFVQKPESVETVDFDNSKKNTKNKSDEKKAKNAASRAKAAKDPMRQVINLELSTAEAVNDSIAIPSDRTRIVVNPTKSNSYETDCDAAKFIADNISQIYTLDNNGVMYAINERPMENGIVNIAVKTSKDGVYTISASRLDCEAKLLDLDTGTVADLTKGGYTFAAEATTYTSRFQLILGDETTAITTAEIMDGIGVEAGAINVKDANANVKVYSMGGALVASQNGAGRINVTAGTYVVKVNGNSVKVTVNE